MLIFEIAGDVRIGLNYLNISGNNVKRKAKGLFKNHCNRGWELIGNILFLLYLYFKKINNEQKYKTYLSSVDVSSTPVIAFTKELPVIEVYGENETTIVWYNVIDNKHIFFQGNGTFYELLF